MELPYIVNCIRQYVQVAPMPTTSHLRSTKCPAYLFIVCWNLSHHISNDSDAQRYHPSRFTKVVSKSKSSNESDCLKVLSSDLTIPPLEIVIQFPAHEWQILAQGGAISDRSLRGEQRTRSSLRDLMFKTLCFHFHTIVPLSFETATCQPFHSHHINTFLLFSESTCSLLF